MNNPHFKDLYDQLQSLKEELDDIDLSEATTREGELSDTEALHVVKRKLDQAVGDINVALSALDPDGEWRDQ